MAHREYYLLYSRNRWRLHAFITIGHWVLQILVYRIFTRAKCIQHKIFRFKRVVTIGLWGFFMPATTCTVTRDLNFNITLTMQNKASKSIFIVTHWFENAGIKLYVQRYQRRTCTCTYMYVIKNKLRNE